MRVCRLGYISGARRGGQGNVSDMLHRFVPALVRAGAVFHVDATHTLYLLPVDDAAELLASLVSQMLRTPQTDEGPDFALLEASQDRPLPLSELFAALDGFGYRLRSLPYDEWRDRALSELRILAAFFPPGGPLLFGGGGGVPSMPAPAPVTTSVLHRYFAFMVDRGLMPGPADYTYDESTPEPPSARE
jgi:hypothetical protein